jgi:hypothetical protein
MVFGGLMLVVAAAVAALAGTAEAGADHQVTPPRGPQNNSAQVGFALAAETVVSPGSVCPASATTPCILGSGGGVAVRFGYRLGSPWYFGGAYEFTRHDSSNVLRLAILQQLRAEARYYFEHGQRTTGFLAAGAGVHIYGNDWGADMAGGLLTVGPGVEFELSAKAVVGCMAMYRLLIPKSLHDGTSDPLAGGPLGFGLAHVFGLEFELEVRDPVPHW